MAVKAYVDGFHTLDPALLRAGLALLPADVEYLWYPSIFGRGDKQHRNALLCELVADVLPAVRFLDQRYQGAHAVSDAARKAADNRLKAVATRPTLPMLYFYGPNHPHVWWRDEQIGEALQLIRAHWGEGADVVIYPGVKRWAEGAQSLCERLERQPAPTRP